MSAAAAFIGPVLRPWTPYAGECWQCHAGSVSTGWTVPLEPVTMLCWPCHDQDLAEYRARMADLQRSLADYERTRLEHVETCRWCAKWNDEHGQIPPAYRCPALGKLEREAAVAS